MDSKSGAKASTKATYQDILKTHLLPAFSDKQIRKIGEDEINKFRKTLVSQELSPRRINSITQLFGSILRVCKRKKVIAENPMDVIDRLQEPKADIDPLSRADLKLALTHIDPFFVPLFTCLAWTGARPNELLALRWRNIDWRHDVIQIKLGRVRGQEGLPKTASSQRDIPILPPVKEALEKLKNAKLANLDDYIFTNKKGLPIDKHLDRIWARALRSAGLKHRASYQLRHTFASLALESGASPAWVSQVLGHGDMSILFRHYARFIRSTSEENVRLMASTFQAKPEPVSLAREGG